MRYVSAMLLLDDVSKRFGAVRAVDGVTVKIARGQVVGVIGRSGAGKSTLLRLVNRLLPPTSGRIVWDGTDVTALRGRALRRWRARCAMIFQQFNLVPRLDVLTNVLIGRLGRRAVLPSLAGRFSADERARAVRALHRLDLVPQALQRADTLSGGQQQRVAIARALVQEPEIVLADEPVASLDPANTIRVMDALLAINREEGITVVCNLHSLELARRYCDRILGVAAGTVVFDGDPGELDAARAHTIYGTDTEDAAAGGGVPEEVTR
jgi:phosphonate transport system ATP-binding protein